MLSFTGTGRRQELPEPHAGDALLLKVTATARDWAPLSGFPRPRAHSCVRETSGYLHTQVQDRNSALREAKALGTDGALAVPSRACSTCACGHKCLPLPGKGTIVATRLQGHLSSSDKAPLAHVEARHYPNILGQTVCPRREHVCP